jgi:hypothetical protein
LRYQTYLLVVGLQVEVLAVLLARLVLVEFLVKFFPE